MDDTEKKPEFENAPERQRKSVVILSERSREIIRLFEQLHSRRQQVDHDRQPQRGPE